MISLFEFDAHTPKLQFSKELEEMYSQRRTNAVEGLLRKLQVRPTSYYTIKWCRQVQK